MATSFSPMLAFGSGLASGIEATEAAKTAERNKQDDEYRQLALKTSFEEALDDHKKQRDANAAQAQAQSLSQQGMDARIGANNSATFASLTQAQISANNPDIRGNTAAGLPPASPPTNNAQGQLPQPAQAQPQGQPSSAPQGTSPAQGGLNSPQGGPVPLSQGSSNAPSALSPPSADTNSTQTGAVIPQTPDDIIQTSQGPITRDQFNRAQNEARLENEKAKGSLIVQNPDGSWNSDAAFSAGLYNVRKQDMELKKGLEDISGKDTPISSLGEKDATHLKAMQNLGIYNQNATELKEPSRSDILDRDKVNTAAYTAYNGALKNQVAYNSLLNLSDNVISGPQAGLQAAIGAAVDKLSGQAYSDAVSNAQVAAKQSIILANGVVANLGSMARPGIGLVQQEAKSVPDINMTPQALKDLIFQGISTTKGVIEQAQATMGGPSQLLAPDRLKMSTEYVNANPPLLADGKTPNPEFKTYAQWVKSVAKGESQMGPTEAQINSAYMNKVPVKQTGGFDANAFISNFTKK